MKTVLFVRHADIDLPPAVPDEQIELNAAGLARAEELGRVGGAFGVTAVFTSALKRTKQTAAPLATAHNLQAKVVPPSLPQFVAAAANGSATLVVGHSPTVPQMIAALLGAPFPFPPLKDFDDLFVVTVGASPSVVRLKYGTTGDSSAPPPSATPAGPVFTNHAGERSHGVGVEFSGVLFHGKPKPQTAVSGADAFGEFLILASDEMKEPTVAQLLKRDGEKFVATDTVQMPVGDAEVDLEGVGVDRATGFVYLTGSHTRTRKVDEGVIEEVKRKKPREQFFRFRLNPDGTAGEVQGPKSLMPAIEGHAALSLFAKVPSKENGIDIEGLAVKGDELFFGCRGPVFREGLVPVLSRRWDAPDDSVQVRYVRLDGRGIRDLAAVRDGFLILAGSVGDGDGTFRVYHWDGADQLPSGESGPKPQLLGEFSGLGVGKPEGLVVLKEQEKTLDVLLLCDGLPGGGPSRWALTRP